MVEHIHLYRLEGDRIAEHWGVRDDLGTLRQLGHLGRRTRPRTGDLRACQRAGKGLLSLGRRLRARRGAADRASPIA